jgi:pyrroline-5-carboxylate reductase
LTDLPKIAFVGAGQMAEAIIRGLIRAQVPPARVFASDIRPERLDYLSAELGIQPCSSNADALSYGEVIVIAVKPQDAPVLLQDLQASAHPAHLVISVAAGVQIATIEAALPPGVPVVRVMPNTAAFVQEGMAVIARGHNATARHEAIAQRIFESVGRVQLLPESKMDAVTALSGSGPGFVALVIEALADGGVAAGLPRPTALELAAQTVLGTGKLVLDLGLHPGVLKDMVASPAGTTIAGLAELESRGVRGAFIQAVVAATQRSEALGQDVSGKQAAATANA